MSLEDWQKSYIQRVLDYHNKKYGTGITNIDRCEDIYPELKDRLNWDWVAIDRNNDREVAIEVKRLTNPQLQERFSVLDQICHELSGELSGDLKGAFILFTEVSEEEHFNLKGAYKERIKENLKGLILREAQSLGTGSEKDLTIELRARLPEVLPQDCYFKLHKLDNDGAYLSPNVGVAWSAPSAELQGEDLVEFQKLVHSANQQLAEAKAKGISETFLIIVEIWFSGAEADVIQKTIHHLNPHDFRFIKYIYHVGHNSVSCVWLNNRDCLSSSEY